MDRRTALVSGLALAGALAGVLALPAWADVAAGSAAADFRLQDQSGKWHTLSGLRGRWVVLYFYPKDQTPGCTTQACEFRDNIFAYEDLGAQVIGVSLDDVTSHQKFADKYQLPFPILADTSGEVAKAYGVLNQIGPIRLARRETFLIAPDGTIAKHYPKVDPKSHSAAVLADLKALGARRPG